MNAPLIPTYTQQRQVISRLVSLAHTLSRRSVERSQWAREAERQGKSALAKRLNDEALKQRADANWYLHWAMARKDAHHGL